MATSKKCEDCFTFVTHGDDGNYKQESLFRAGRAHNDCFECGKAVVCNFKGICGMCDYPVHAITERVSVGSCAASYEPFDVIFDLNYPENFVHRREIEVKFQDGQCICRFGILDHAEDAEYMQVVVAKLAALLPNLTNKRILFHCFAGYSRSVTAAAAFLALSGEVDSVLDGVEMIRRVRKYIGPKEALLHAAVECVEQLRSNGSIRSNENEIE